MTRTSGISVPLFSIVTSRGWGIGEFPDLVDFGHWAARAGQSLIQILPVMELPEFERSPYSALTSCALDPTYIALPDVPDFDAIGGELAFEPHDRLMLAEAREAHQIDYAAVRRLKQRWLRRAWERFTQRELAAGSPRARAFDDYCTREAWWLDDYAVFRALLTHFDQRAWWEWPEPFRSGSDDACREARRLLADEIAYRKYLQWIADEQWAAAREAVFPLRVFGDLPFMISGNSDDVWRRQEQFHLDATVGAPPDAFAADGQDWGLPPWRWQELQQNHYAWMRQRARRMGQLFSGFRIDHLVGLYRTWIRLADRSREPYFDPADEPAQQALGDALVRVFQSSGAEVIAEDLGTVPPFVRASITALGVPGFKVMRWERRWDELDQPAIDPTTFAELSVATTGTHDIEPLAATMDADDADRALDALLGSGSYLTLVPLQDVFGWPDRINTPSLVDGINWTWRVPKPVDTWTSWPLAQERQQHLAARTRAAGR
ncbi:MAG: 4-alpha-glucanotransferase [Acidobacteria bacterium]|nr:4-alpha-glucanotransferase [Acidobacteriota bacterium]